MILALPAKHIMSAIGATVSISGFAVLAMTDSVKNWVKTHPYPIYLALIVAVLVIAGTLDYAHNLRRQLKLPSKHDKKLYAAALDKLPPNGAVVGWLKQAGMAQPGIADFPSDVLGALEKTVESSRMQPAGFDDPRIAASFRSLIGAITRFCQSVDSWTLAAQAGHSGRITAALDQKAAALTRRHRELVRAYDRFIRTSHVRGIDIDGSP